MVRVRTSVGAAEHLVRVRVGVQVMVRVRTSVGAAEHLLRVVGQVAQQRPWDAASALATVAAAATLTAALTTALTAALTTALTAALTACGCASPA